MNQKTLILMRHAKTEAQHRDGTDFERNLTESGRKAAAESADAMVAGAGVKPQIIYVSRAARTMQTAEIVIRQANFHTADAVHLEQLYHASPSAIEELLMLTEDNVETVLLIGHNPGISELAMMYGGGALSEGFSTAAFAVFQFNADAWTDLPLSRKKMIYYHQPNR